MSTSKPDERADLLDQLSAYLDGELSASGCRKVEQLLADDASARSELRRLKQASELLDDLPRRDVEPSFTETTISMVAVAEEETLDAATSNRGGQGWRRWAMRGGTLLLAVVGGFIAMAAVRPRPNDVLLNDLPVIENLDAYRQAGSIEFLRELKAHDLFTKDESP
jgi:anti-sigma factor RsiW